MTFKTSVAPYIRTFKIQGWIQRQRVAAPFAFGGRPGQEISIKAGTFLPVSSVNQFRTLTVKLPNAHFLFATRTTINHKMFSKIAIFAAAAAVVAATPFPGGEAPSTGGSCNTGPTQCCNSVYESSSAQGAALAGLLPIALQGLTGQIHSGCSPLTVVGLGEGSSCSSTPVCCSGNHFEGLIVIGCSPISL